MTNEVKHVVQVSQGPLRRRGNVAAGARPSFNFHQLPVLAGCKPMKTFGWPQVPKQEADEKGYWLVLHSLTGLEASASISPSFH